MFFTSQEFQTVAAALNSGFLKTLQIFFITLIGALPLGLVISFGSMSRFAPLRWLTRMVVWAVRGTPLVLQIIALYYVPGMKDLFTWPSGETGRMTAVCVAFVINYACYFSEIYRAGIQGVPVGQQEAGLVLGMTRRQIFFKVTLLQMVKRIVPPMSNGRVLHERQPGLFGAGVAPLLHRRVLPGLHRRGHRPAGPAGEEAGIFPLRRRCV